MFIIDERKRIKGIKGDTAIFDIACKNHVFKDGDKVYFTVKYSVDDSENIIQKIITKFDNNIAKIILDKNDTNIEVGSYLYDVQLSLVDGRVDTIVVPSKFEIIGGVTHE